MAATYNATLPTTRDWVRFLIGDREVADEPVLQDEEIDALLVEAGGNKYLAAASAGEAVLLEFGSIEQVDAGDVKVRWSQKKTDDYRRLLATFKAKALGSGASFRVV